MTLIAKCKRREKGNVSVAMEEVKKKNNRKKKIERRKIESNPFFHANPNLLIMNRYKRRSSGQAKRANSNREAKPKTK